MTPNRSEDFPALRLPAAWRWWLPPALLSLILTLVFLDPFAGDWDALDYTILALRGEPSSMLFGRMLFIFTNHFLWRAAHAVFSLPPEQSYLLFKYAVVAQTPLAIISCWALARELTGDRRVATVAALLIACSPFFVIYSGQAMTEIPSILWLAAALTIHCRGLRRQRIWLVLLGAALLGVSVNIREAGLLYGPWLVAAPFVCGWRFERRTIVVTLAACVLFMLCALGPFALWFWLDVNSYRAAWHGWVSSMRMESAVHPVRLRNYGPLLLFFFIAAPLILVAAPVALYREWRAHGFSPPLLMALVSLFANLSLITHYSVVLNGRYLLTGLPGLAPLVAGYFLRAEEKRADATGWRPFGRVLGGIALTTVVLGAAVYPMAWPTLQAHGHTKDYLQRLALLPKENSVVIAGSQTVSVTFWRGVGAGDWDVIGTGGGWPGDKLVEVITGHLQAGRRVFLDADPRWWTMRGWQRQETEAVVNLEPLFRFRRVSDTIYEIRPADDASAADKPNLRRMKSEV